MALERKRTLASQLVEQLAARIRAGELAPGDRLPTEKELADAYGVSRTVVREAISGLRAHGFVRTVQGRGAFVMERPSVGAAGAFHAATLEDVLHLVEFRCSLEPAIAALAAQRRSHAALRRLGAARAALGEAQTSPERLAAADYDFHRAIAEAAGNPYFMALMDQLGPGIIPHARINLYRVETETDDAFLARVEAEHEAIFAAVAKGQPEQARRAMSRHLENSRHRYSLLAATRAGPAAPG
ncbi:MAG: FadR/GntR family transcriptional regulator [Alphaproteobacteria bacterium]